MKRQPKSDSGRATKLAILEAATQIVLREGIEKLNTNLVAERAGISIGSLYQYYDNKDEIARDLLRSVIDRRVQNVRDALGISAAFSSIDQIISKVVDAMFETEAESDAKLEAMLYPLILAANHDGIESHFEQINETIKPLLKTLLIMKEPGLKDRDLETVAFILMQAGRATILGLSMPHTQNLHRDRVKLELKRLFASYLSYPSDPRCAV